MAGAIERIKSRPITDSDIRDAEAAIVEHDHNQEVARVDLDILLLVKKAQDREAPRGEDP